MTDRLVRALTATVHEAAPQPFSAFLSTPNIVLLGDPGAGKSYLFQHFANVEKARYLPARTFLNLDPASVGTSNVFFIDALDEKRSGRGDQNTIDQIVARLCVLRPERLRIACRAADWLGETDLAAFQTYFAQVGAHVVVALEPLSSEEQLRVLEQAGIGKPYQFLQQARGRGLDELLTNPQNLIMLARVVLGRDWPKNRTELFRSAVDILLSEHNPTHSRHLEGSFTSKELLEPAGNLSAVRLISDIDGISVAEFDVAEQLPSYRKVTIGDLDKTRATLGRRAFVSGYVPETVDYTHRTVAEYLAAAWLCQQVRQGLPLGRVRALLGVDGRPASELRGLHAWLPIFLPEHAREIIDADAFGVLSYGDAASLSASDRQHLLDALARLAQLDPWFRSGNWSSTAVASLSGPDMVEQFRRLLSDKSTGFTLRSVVLDALSTGVPIPELREDLGKILRDQEVPYGERHSSLEALRRLRPAGDELVADIYSELGVTPDDLRLRAAILTELYGVGFSAANVAALLNDALTSGHGLVGGAFWSLDATIPKSDIAEILDAITLPPKNSTTREDWQSAFEVVHLLDSLPSCGYRRSRRERDFPAARFICGSPKVRSRDPFV